MSRVPADFSVVGYGHDPVNGSVEEIASQALTMRNIARQLDDAHGALDSAFNADQKSERLDKLLADVRSVSGKLSLVVTRYHGAAHALDTYASKLAPLQRAADAAAREAVEEHRKDAAQHATSADLYRQIQTAPDPATATRLESDYRSVEARRNTARSNVEGAKKLISNLVAERKQAAEAASNEIKHAMEASGLNDTIIDKVKRFIANAGEWLKKHAEALTKIGEAIGNFSTVLSILALIPTPLSPLFKAAAVAVGVVGATFTIAGALGKALKDGNWGAFAMTTGLSVLGIIAGSKALGKAANTTTFGQRATQGKQLMEKGLAALKNGTGHSTPLINRAQGLVQYAKGTVAMIVNRDKLSAFRTLRGIGVSSKATAMGIVEIGSSLAKKVATKSLSAVVHSFIARQPSHGGGCFETQRTYSSGGGW